jgi:uncharacterized repeat protein (TIGR02543 family)
MKSMPLLLAIFLGILFSLTFSMCTNVFMEQLLKRGQKEITPVDDPNVPGNPDIIYHTVIFNSNGGSAVDNQTIADGGTASRPENPTKPGFGFVNWYSNEDLTEPHYDFATPVTADLTLYAQWSNVFYTVEFESNGGSAVHSLTVGEGGTASRPVPTRDDYAFSGWYSDPGLTVLYDFETPVFADLTLYAKWIQNTAIITITVEQIEDHTPDIDGGTIFRGGFPNTRNLIAPDGYDSYEWSIEGIGTYAGLITLSESYSCIVSAEAKEYNSPGKHAVYLVVYKNGIPYSKTIWVTIVGNIEEDFGAGAFIDGVFNVAIITEWDAAVSTITNGDNDKNYIINVPADFTVAGSTTATFGDVNGIKVSLRGVGSITLSGNGNLIRTGDNQTVILRELTLQGHNSNSSSVVYVEGANSAFTMQSGKISGNNATGGGGGVYVGGTFTMNGGEISGNSATYSGGGGVLVSDGGDFTMRGGKISDNTLIVSSAFGSGVYVIGTCTMEGGEVSGNTTITNGGGVFVSNGAFIMHGGKISGNEAGGVGGGGVYVIQNSGTSSFTMYGGEISGNTATGSAATNGGGGVHMYSGTFRIVTGIIYGSNESDTSLRNTATNLGAALYNNGTAQRGTFSGANDAWVSNGNLATTNNTIKVVRGNLE